MFACLPYKMLEPKIFEPFLEARMLLPNIELPLPLLFD
jgi:hypothetical protein